MSAGDLTQFAMRAGFVGLGFGGLQGSYSDMQKACDAASRLFAAVDGTATPTAEDAAIATPTAGTRGHLQLDQVCFGYQSDQPAVLSSVSLQVAPGSIVGVAGRSGVGKSTLFSLASGLYRCNGGSVLLDGVPLGGAAAQEWAGNNIGAVEQDAVLLSGTIQEAIGYGLAGASLEEIQAAARAAHAHDFICKLPEGYSTQVGPRGSALSGGQRARVALARAVLKKPRLLLLDEVTAGLDKENEQVLVATLQGLCTGGCSVVVFTHSQAVMQACNLLHLLVDSSTVVSGTYDELCKSVHWKECSQVRL